MKNTKGSYIAYGQHCPYTEMKEKEFRDFIIGNQPVEAVLLEILVHESMEITELSQFRGKRSVIGMFGRSSTLARFEGRFAVSSYRLEDSGYRRTFSRHKDYMIDNWMIETLPNDCQDKSKRGGIYYNTTPLGKVLAMKYWYNEFLKGKKPLIIKTNEHIELPKNWSKLSEDEKGGWQQDGPDGRHILDDGRLGIEIKPNDLLISFFQSLPGLKKFSDDIKKLFSGFGPKDVLQFTFSEIDINYTSPNNRAAVEVKFRSKYETDVKIIRYFGLNDLDNIQEMYNHIFDSLTYIFLTNLETMQKELDVKNPVIAKILEDPELKSFRQKYQMDAQQVIRESLNSLSVD